MFFVFGEGVGGVFLNPWCGDSLNDTLRDLNGGFYGPVVSGAERAYILDIVLLLFLRIEVPDVWWEGGDFEVLWLCWDQEGWSDVNFQVI